MVMQMETVECGAACLTMVLAYYGKWLSLEEVRLACNVSRDGSSAKDIIHAARNYGLEAHGYSAPYEMLDGWMQQVMQFNPMFHYVTVQRFQEGESLSQRPGNRTRGSADRRIHQDIYRCGAHLQAHGNV